MKPREFIFITGGAGFIGTHVVEHFAHTYGQTNFVILDAFTYAANGGIALELKSKYFNVDVEVVDIRDFQKLLKLFTKYKPSGVIHLAAESHVDNSIRDPFTFAQTNVLGTLNLLECAKRCWENNMEGKLFYHVSTDEVYGALSVGEVAFTEQTRYNPHSPYSASKASSDHFVRAYHDTYGLPIKISNCSNNYGPHQHHEKLIPLVISNLYNRKPIPVYGTGQNIRDWLYVEDHADAIDHIYHLGEVGETYNIGSNCEKTNLEIVETLCNLFDEYVSIEKGKSLEYVTFVEDRKGHDFRYAIDNTKLKSIGWEPKVDFETGIKKTFNWYMDHL